MISNDLYQDVRRALDFDQLMREAKDESGLSDYGDETFVTALANMRECYSKDQLSPAHPHFHAKGLEDFRGQIVRNLVNRLRFQDDLKKHPEILDEDVSDPIIILGFPRSGTTKTHRMVGQDRALFATRMWQLINPAPFPNRAAAGARDPRILGSLGLDSLMDDNPALHAAHYYAAEEIQEDLFLFFQTFNGWIVGSRTLSQSYKDWLFSRTDPSDLHSYRYVRSLLQYLQWQQGGRGHKRWLLKNTNNLGHLDEILAVYPAASFTHIHRHPRSTVPSISKLMLAALGTRQDNVGPRFLAQFILEWETRSMKRYLESRDRLGLDDRILDVPYEKMRTNPMPAIREMYRRAGHGLTAEGEMAMLRWEAKNEQGKHGAHTYSLDEFGLSEKIIDDAFAPYIQRFLR